MSKTKTDVGILESESNTCLDDDSTASDRVLGGTCLVVAQYGVSKPDIHLAAGEGDTCQRTGSSERNSPQDDDSTASAAVLSCDCMDTSTSLIGLACAHSGILILGDTQGKVQRASMESLPADIVQEILSLVPADSVLECKLVCKKWITVIRGSNFANMHLSRQLNHLHDGEDGDDNIASKVDSCLFFACRIDDPDEFISLLFHGGRPSDRISNGEEYIYNQNLKRIYHPPMHNEPLYNHLVGSCNGLVCAFQQHHIVVDPIYICNPLTREYVYLPQLVIKKEDIHHNDNPHRIQGGEVDMLSHTACGFGYVRSTNEYKVVRIYYLEYFKGNVEVYTLGSGCGWRAMGEVPHQLDMSDGGIGTYADGAIYWISYNKVVSFDLADEEFRVLSSVPPRMEKRREGRDMFGLVALGRHLCLYIDDELHVEIWSLMRGRNSKRTWRMEFDINYEAIAGTRYRELPPISLTKKGEIILLYCRSVLYSYDPKTSDLKRISNEATTDSFLVVEAIAHVNTFASLEAMGENSKRYVVYTPLDDVIGDLDRVGLHEGIDTTRFKLR